MNWSRRIIPAVCVVVALRALMGCGSSGGSSAAGGPSGTVEGWVFSQAGAIVLGSSAPPPAGAAPVVGGTVTITGRSGSVSTDAAGHFVAPSTPIGQRTLRVAPPPGSGFAAADQPVTVITSATVRVGAYPISRQQAIDAAKADLAAVGTVADFRLLAPQQPLPPGVTVAPALGNDRGEDDPGLTHTIGSTSWLVYADPVAGERFMHTVYYVLVEAQTGAVTRREATSWPRINGVSHYADDDRNAAAPDLVQAGAVRSPKEPLLESARRVLAARGRDHVPGATDPKTYALFVQGNSRSDMAADLDNVKASLLGPEGLSGPSVVKTWSPPESGVARAQSEVRALFDEICAQARPQDTLLIYVTSHGSRSGAIYLQQGPESDESSVRDGAMFPYLDLDTSRCAACHVIFIIDACYAGEAMVEMDVKTPPHAGQKRTTIVSSTGSETSGGITRRISLQNGTKMGGRFTNAFLDSLKSFRQTNGSAGQSNLTDIFNGAVTRMNSDRQHPQTVFRWDGKTCGAQPKLVEVTPESFTAKHTVGVTSCPQDLGTLSIKNLTTSSLSLSYSLNSSYFSLSGSGGTLSAGQTKTAKLDFNCGRIPPLSASISVTATQGSLNQHLSVPVTLNLGP